MLSSMEILSLNSFVKNGMEIHLYCYEDIKNVRLLCLYTKQMFRLPNNIFCVNNVAEFKKVLKLYIIIVRTIVGANIIYNFHIYSS